MDIKARRGTSKTQLCDIESGGEGTSSVNKQKWLKKASPGARRTANPHVRCKELDLASGTPCNCNTGTGVDPAQQKMRYCLLRELQSKLQSLEEDMNLLKKIVLSCAEERAALMNEISRQFDSIKDCSVNSEAGATSFCLQPIFNPPKEEDNSRKMGLVEVLVQMENSIPAPVTRDMKVNFYYGVLK